MDEDQWEDKCWVGLDDEQLIIGVTYEKRVISQSIFREREKEHTSKTSRSQLQRTSSADQDAIDRVAVERKIER